MNLQEFNEKIFTEIDKYQNVLGKENGSKLYLSVFDHLVPTNSLVFLAGRPRSGKTSLILDFIARNSLLPKQEAKPFINDIMSRRGMVFFIGQKEEMIPLRWFNIINQNMISNKEPDQYLDYIKDEYLGIVEGANIDFEFLPDCENLPSRINEGIKKENPDYIVVDNIPFATYNEMDYYERPDYSNDNELVRSLIDLQKESKKFFLIASSLGHDAWMRSGNKRHHLEDLHSTFIDENSDLVIMLHRPELYGLDIDECGNSLKGIIEVDCVLNRYGNINQTSYWSIADGIPKKVKIDC